MSQHLPIEETDVYRKSEDLADTIWDLVDTWKPFARDTVGKQLVRAADSVGANLVEGDGRYSDKDSLNFFTIARASARETGHWLRRAKRRKLVKESIADELLRKLEFILKSLNGLINYRRERGKFVHEEIAAYDLAHSRGEVSDSSPFPETRQPSEESGVDPPEH